MTNAYGIVVTIKLRVQQFILVRFGTRVSITCRYLPFLRTYKLQNTIQQSLKKEYDVLSAVVTKYSMLGKNAIILCL